MGNLCCQYTGCAWRRHPGLQSNADNIQGVLEDTLVSWFGDLLVMVTRMDVLMCFRADILLEIPRVHVKVQVSRPSLGRGMVPSVCMDPGEYCT